MDRICDIVIRCMLDGEGYVTIATLSDLSGISVSSIKQNLVWIRKELERFDIELKSTPKKGVRLIATEEQRQKALQKIEEEANEKTESFVYRKGYILDTLFMFPANYTIQLFAEELSVSRNMIQKDLEQIEQQLSKLHVSIKKVRNQGVLLKGAEFNVRQAIIEHNNSKYWTWNPTDIMEVAEDFDSRISKKAYTYLTDTYSTEILLEMQKLLHEAEEILDIQLVDIDFCRVIEYLMITQQRVKSGNIIRETGKEEKLVIVDKSYIQTAQIIIDKILPHEKNIELEVQYLAARIFVDSTCGRDFRRAGEEYKKASRAYLKAIGDMLEIKKISYDAELNHEISLMFEKIHIRENYQILSWSDLHRDIQEQLSALYAVCMVNIFIVEESIGTMIRQDDVAWLTLLIYNFLNSDTNKTKAIFIHATTSSNALYQKQKIEREINNLVITNSIYFKKFDIEQFDRGIAICTVPLKQKRGSVIEVTKHVNQKDIEYIKFRLEELEEKNLDDERDTILHEVFKEDLMIPDLKARDKEEAITGMNEYLIRLGYVEEGFINKVLEREVFCPTAIGKGIAIPHHYKEHIVKSGIAVAKLRHRITWTKVEKVDMVFLIANEFDDAHKVQILFKYLYDLFENEEKINQLRSAIDSRQMLNTILEKGVNR